MPILGNLSEFPLPEVLLLIGTRTGRLRLLDVPEFGIMDVDFSNGEVESLYLGVETFTESKDIIEKLSAVIQAQGGMFEFRLHPVASVARPCALQVNQLVMSLVCHVDEEIAKKRALTSAEHQYLLAVPQPEIWVEPELNLFFHQARQLLTVGTSLSDLAEQLGMDVQVVHQHLNNLRLLGLLQLVDLKDTTQLNEIHVQDKISRKSNDFLRASRAANEIKRLTGKIPSVKKT